MRKVKFVIIILLLVCVCSACSDNVHENRASVSNLYETDLLIVAGDDNVEFHIPQSIYDTQAIEDDSVRYEYEDLQLLVYTMPSYGLTNELLHVGKNGIIKATLKQEWVTQLISEETIELDGIDAVEVSSSAKMNDKEYHMNNIVFIYDEKLYYFMWLVESDSDIDYSKDYECFKETISLKNNTESGGQHYKEIGAEYISNLYETESLISVGDDNVEFQIPKSLYNMQNVEGEWTQYAYEELRLLVCVTDSEGLTNEQMLDSKEGVIKGILDAEGFGELWSEKTTFVSGIEAIEMVVTANFNDIAYHMNCVLFTYKSKMYCFFWAVESDSDTDYSMDYERFKEKIHIENGSTHTELEDYIEETEVEVIHSYTHVFDGTTEMISYSFTKDKGGDFYFNIRGLFETEWKASVTYKVFREMFADHEFVEKGWIPDLTIWCGDVFMTEEGMWYVSNGEEIDFEEWYDEKSDDFEPEAFTEFSIELFASVDEFLESEE